MLPIISRLSEKYSFNREINGERIKRVDCMSSFMKDVERDILDTTLKMFKDVVLMYIQMSVMDGLEATRLIRTFNAYIPIIAVTANAFESDRVAVLQAGCSYFLSKPIEKSKLIKVIEEVTAE